MKKALITGVRGQDGAYLSKLLIDKGYEVYGADIKTDDNDIWRLKKLGVDKKIKFVYIDLNEMSNVLDIVKSINPDEVYNLAEKNFVKDSFEQPIFSASIDAMGTLRVLDAVRKTNIKIKYFQSSTAQMIGELTESGFDNVLKFHPKNPYGVSKLYAHWMTVNYRESYNMFACSGIMFNHESPLREITAISRKITSSVVNIKNGKQEKLVLSNLNAKRDLGYAPEYVEAMWLMLQQDKPNDYIIATGQTHSVREFAEIAFKYAGINIEWKGSGLAEKGINKSDGKTLVEVSKEFIKPNETDDLKGDYSKAQNAFGWKPKTHINELVELMIKNEEVEINKQ